MPTANEGAPLVPQAEQPTRTQQAIWVLGSCLAYICLSASLINFNKFLMHEDKFPHSIALTWFHMVVSSTLACVLYAIFGEKWFPAMPMVKREGSTILKKLIPLSLFFATSIVMSNQAYLYCSVPFLQMCKELNVVMVYVVGLALMVEKFNLQNSLILLGIMFGCCMSIHGEMRFNGIGFGYQMGGQCSEVLKIILQQMIMQGLKVDPLTMVMIMSPLCLITLSAGLFFMWQPGIWAHAMANWPYLLLNGSNAFLLNIAVATVIKYASGVSFVLAGVIKDVCIVLCAATMFGAVVMPIQVIGFSIAVMGVGTHSIVRSMPEMAKEYGVAGTVGFAVFGIHPAGKEALP
jgi:hypothetical protein